MVTKYLSEKKTAACLWDFLPIMKIMVFVDFAHQRLGEIRGSMDFSMLCGNFQIDKLQRSG